MKTTKKQLEAIKEIEKKVSEVCDTKKTVEVTRNDDGVIINKETGKPYFEHLSEKKGTDIAISLNFGIYAPSLKKQIEKQGFKISNQYVKEAEVIKTELHALKNIGILKEKELLKCFDRLSKMIFEIIIHLELKEKKLNK